MYATAATLKVLTKMARVVATIKLMPESPESDLSAIEMKAKRVISNFTENDEIRSEQEPIAFGLKAINLTFVMDENKGSPDVLEGDLMSIDGVNSVQTTDVRRAIG